MPLSSETDWCTQVRYASVIYTGNVTDDCLASLSPRCSLPILQLFLRIHGNSRVQNGIDIGSRNRLLKTRWLVDDEGLTFRTIHAGFHVFSLSLLNHGSPHRTRTDHDDDRWSFRCLTSPKPGSQDFILVFDVPSPKCFAQPGDHHSCQANNIASALEKRRKFSKKYSYSKSVFAKSPVKGRSFQKDLQDIVETKRPQSLNVWRQIFQNRRKQKTLQNEHNSGKERDNFALRTKIVAREPHPKHSRVAESLPRSQLVIHP